MATMLSRFITTLTILIFLSVTTLPVHATQYDQYLQRRADLVSLSGIFGQLHHIRRTCNPRREANIWRERMQNLIELEEPDSDSHLDMVNAFNDGFRKAGALYPDCTRLAQDAGKSLASEGNQIVGRLTEPLQDTQDSL